MDDWTGSRYVVRSAKHAPGGIAVIMGGLGDAEEQANAHLVAASPQLLATLKELRRSFHMAQVVMDAESRKIARSILEDVDAVIAKAERTEGTHA
jgi:hypothetical protein